MKKSELKTLWKVARLYWCGGIFFWIVETLVFLIIEGWHYEATNSIEIYCDKIVTNIWLFALNLTIFICVCFLFNLNKTFKS